VRQTDFWLGIGFGEEGREARRRWEGRGSWEVQVLRLCDKVGETQVGIKLLLAKRVKKSTMKLVLTLLTLGYPKFLL
jgi:hypothetical protein